MLINMKIISLYRGEDINLKLRKVFPETSISLRGNKLYGSSRWTFGEELIAEFKDGILEINNYRIILK